MTQSSPIIDNLNDAMIMDNENVPGILVGEKKLHLSDQGIQQGETNNPKPTSSKPNQLPHSTLSKLEPMTNLITITIPTNTNPTNTETHHNLPTTSQVIPNEINNEPKHNHATTIIPHPNLTPHSLTYALSNQNRVTLQTWTYQLYSFFFIGGPRKRGLPGKISILS